MAATIQELEARVSDLQNEVAVLREKVARCSEFIESAEGGGQQLRVARESQAEIAAAAARVLQRLGITEKPIGAAKLRERIQASGINPEDNEFSREIIRMREERG